MKQRQTGNRNRWIQLSIALLSMTCGTLALASDGAGASGGGDVAILPDDRVVLADHYYSKEPARAGTWVPFELPKPLLAEVNRVDMILKNYFNWPFIKRAVLEDVRYYLVTDFPSNHNCDDRLNYWDVPENAKIAQVACTDRSQTWILESLFKKMTVRDQALLLVHEGLRRTERLKPITEYQMGEVRIPSIVTGLNTALSVLNEQIQGTRRNLSNPEMTSLEKLTKVIIDVAGCPIRYTNGCPEFFIWPHGGGLIFPNEGYKLSIDPEAFLGIGTLVTNHYLYAGIIPGETTIAKADILGSALFCGGGCQVESSATIHFSRILAQGGFNARENTVINDSRLGVFEGENPIRGSTRLLPLRGYSCIGCGYFEVAEGAKISNAIIISDEFSLGKNSSVRNSLFHDIGRTSYWPSSPSITIGSNSLIENTSFSGLKEIGDRTSIKSVRFYAPFGKIGNDVNFSNLDAATYLPENSFYNYILRGFHNGALKIKSGASLDFGGKTLCRSGRNHFTGYLMVKEPKDLIKGCE